MVATREKQRYEIGRKEEKENPKPLHDPRSSVTTPRGNRGAHSTESDPSTCRKDMRERNVSRDPIVVKTK
jgi:hypothetical protein